jgi:hypothetical protein
MMLCGVGIGSVRPRIVAAILRLARGLFLCLASLLVCSAALAQSDAASTERSGAPERVQALNRQAVRLYKEGKFGDALRMDFRRVPSGTRHRSYPTKEELWISKALSMSLKLQTTNPHSP